MLDFLFVYWGFRAWQLHVGHIGLQENKYQNGKLPVLILLWFLNKYLYNKHLKYATLFQVVVEIRL